MSFKELYSYGNSLGSQGFNNISSPGESVIEQSNLTTKFYEDRDSHRISNYSSASDDIFDIDHLKVYETPVDTLPAPKFTTKEVEKLKLKFQEFKSKPTKPKEISPRPAVKSPLLQKKKLSVDKVTISSLTPVQTLPSYKKPLLTVNVEIAGRNISEDVVQGDNSIEIAKRVFVQAGVNGSQQGIKNLSEMIQRVIGEYMLQVSQELQKFHKSSKKIQQEQARVRLDKFKPPLLATERRAEEKKQLIGSVNVNVEGLEIVVPIREGDAPEKIAEKVCSEHGIRKEMMQLVLEPIKDFVVRADKKFLFKVEFDVDGKNAEIAVHEEDDLSALAKKFVRDNKIGRENISTIEQILIKQKMKG